MVVFGFAVSAGSSFTAGSAVAAASSASTASVILALVVLFLVVFGFAVSAGSSFTAGSAVAAASATSTDCVAEAGLFTEIISAGSDAVAFVRFFFGFGCCMDSSEAMFKNFSTNDIFYVPFG